MAGREDRLWRTLADLEPDAAARAVFPRLAEAALIDRRMALRLMGASAALALASGASGCGGARRDARDPRKGAPFETRRTTLDMNGQGFGVLVETVNGMPVKIEGDPDHPASLGRSNAFAQAAVLSYYDPDRPDRALARGAGGPEALAALDRLGEAARAAQGAGLHVLLEPIASPTIERLVDRLREALPRARFYRHRPIPVASLVAEGLDRAELVVSIGADFLGPGPLQVRHAADYMAGRRDALRSGRGHATIVAESVPTLTGARADHRIAAGPERLARLCRSLAGESVADLESGFIAATLGQAMNRGVLILDGAWEREIAALSRVATARFNTMLARRRRLTVLEDLPGVELLARALAAGEVARLVTLGGNPAYTAPPGLDMARLIRRARHHLHIGPEANETARAADTFVPQRPHLASWGDLRAFDGSVAAVRPVAPGHGPTLGETLSRLLGEERSARALVAQTHGAAERDLAEADWSPPASRIADIAVPPRRAPAAPEPPAARAERALSLVLIPDATVWDGSLAANAWAQELPDPVTGLSWGNALLVAPVLARKLGVREGDEVEITTPSGHAAAPVKIMPGQARDVVALSLGHGRRAAGVGSGIGVDAYRLGAAGVPVRNVTVRPTGARRPLAFANPYEPVGDQGAVRWVSPDEEVRRASPAQENPAFARPEPAADRQWGMVIDLDACIGCNACTIACQAENNIPVVGPEETRAGRAMHWLRVERYHRGAPENPRTAFQPVPCMHCGTAPCEPVCPVTATTHSSEGLNEMTYERCIGTRSCSNNCPYKVRKFNWFDYREQPGNPPEAGTNPQVTIRDRGVMEKCTYCVQRIEAARLTEGGTEPVTACQQACPTQAITFGDLADPASPVARQRGDARNYELLEGHNLFPRTTYLARRDAGDA